MCASIWVERICVCEMELEAVDVNQIGKLLIAKEGLIVAAKFI